MKKKTVIGILAHVDSGKTTLSECMLYLSGEIRKQGRVDHRDTFLDTHGIERDRGITIFSKQAQLSLENTEVTLLDTPGHVDFSAETERVLRVLDYAVLVISASDGVQSHTETLWRLLTCYGVPTFIFINKTDIAKADEKELMAELASRLSDSCVNFSGMNKAQRNENIAMCSETAMEEFLKCGSLESETIAEAVLNRNVFPCYFGSALKCKGVAELLSGIDEYTLKKEYGTEFAARVFKITTDSRGERLTHLKVTGGVLKVRGQLCGVSEDGAEWCEKVNRIRIYSGEKFSASETAEAGTICAVTGLSKTYAGQGLGAAADGGAQLLEPVMTYRVDVKSGADIHTALGNLRRLEEEDPQLHVIWNEQLGEIHVRLMGEIQKEVLARILRERFGMETEFGEGSIVYKETIANKVEGVGHYEPLRHYAEVHLALEPLPRGSGVRFECRVSEDELDRNWQRLIMTHLKEKTHIGVLTGSPVTDIKISLIAGRAHKKHTEGGDFRQAVYRAVRQGLMSAESVLLEPWYEFQLEVPSDCVGRAMTDIRLMGGDCLPPENNGDTARLSGTAPASELQGYHAAVTEYTRGKGRLFCTLKEYAPCHNADAVISEIGYDCERDVENTADSVFCSHGAGFLVKWDEVFGYMHIGRVLAEENSEPEPISAVRVREFIDTVSEDAELMKIFERTYGPIKRRERDAMRTVKNPVPTEKPTNNENPIKTSATTEKQPKNEKPAKSLKSRSKDGTEYLLVDGYNIIFAWDWLKKQAEDNLDLARSSLINTLCNYRGFRRCEVILVFDAYRVKGGCEKLEKHGGISVIYTKEAETADSYIERVSHALSRNHSVRVATSDNMEQLIILGNGALRISADAFLSEVRAVEKAIREYITEKSSV